MYLTEVIAMLILPFYGKSNLMDNSVLVVNCEIYI